MCVAHRTGGSGRIARSILKTCHVIGVGVGVPDYVGSDDYMVGEHHF
jgi:hypothetical protein